MTGYEKSINLEIEPFLQMNPKSILKLNSMGIFLAGLDGDGHISKNV
jgi:hypothetical protein